MEENKQETPETIHQSILDEMEKDMLDSCMPVGEVESCLIHWTNKYLFTRR